jgi:sulfide:quinone oxidoreductase
MNGRRQWRVVVAGAGVAGLEAALALNAWAHELVSVELVAPDEDFVYKPLAVAEPFEVGEVRRFPLRTLVEAAGATLRTGSVVSVDPELKLVWLEDGETLPYDALLLALGARPREAVSGALTFRGPQDEGALAALLDRATAGELRRIVFALPAGTGWPLPLYELAMLTRTYLANRGTRGVEVRIVSPEERPLAIFGPAASDAVAELLGMYEVAFEPASAPVAFADGRLTVLPPRSIEADAVVATPQLEGLALDGVPHDDQGFVPVDEFCAVRGLTDVYAAGDLTRFPLKQGGVATQQADVAAASIAADAGAPVRPEPFQPVLRGLLVTGSVPRFLRAEAMGGGSTVDTEPLWWPPAKIVGRYLAPFLAKRLGVPEEPPAEGALRIDVALDELSPAGLHVTR